MQIEISRTLYVTPPTGVSLVSTLDDNQRNNIAPFAWWLVVSKEPPLIALSLKPDTNTYRIIKSTGEFVIGIPVPGLVDTVYSAAKIDKEADEASQLGITVVPSIKINAPQIKECPVNIECRFHDELPCGDHILVIGSVQAVTVDDELVRDDDSEMRAALQPLGHLTKNKFIAIQGDVIEATEKSMSSKSQKR